MLHIKSLPEGLDLFKALGSDVRIEIVRILLENNGMNMNELASRLNITNGALTSHIKKLEECGIVTVSSETSGHGNQKICSVHLDKILIDLQNQEKDEDVYTTSIKVGLFSDYEVYPTCGLASASKIIGQVDDTRYFSHPDRYDADILWFTKDMWNMWFRISFRSHRKLMSCAFPLNSVPKLPVSTTYGLRMSIFI